MPPDRWRRRVRRSGGWGAKVRLGDAGCGSRMASADVTAECRVVVISRAQPAWRRGAQLSSRRHQRQVYSSPPWPSQAPEAGPMQVAWHLLSERRGDQHTKRRRLSESKPTLGSGWSLAIAGPRRLADRVGPLTKNPTPKPTGPASLDQLARVRRGHPAPPARPQAIECQGGWKRRPARAGSRRKTNRRPRAASGTGRPPAATGNSGNKTAIGIRLATQGLVDDSL